MESTQARPVQLHVIHGLGGGSTKWLRDFVEADEGRTNLVLRSFTHDDAAGGGVALFANATDEAPIATWMFEQPIPAAVVTHPEYLAALEAIVAQHAVGAILVSSLIGHSLEVLDTGLPTVIVNHDYFPYCPAINLYFDDVCRQCDGNRLALCHAENARFNPFAGFDVVDRLRVRERFLEAVRRPNVTMVAPSLSVSENLVRIEPRFLQAKFVTIAHGYGNPLLRVPGPEPARDDRLRVLVLGQLSVAKGSEVIEAAIAGVAEFAEIWLVGAREVGEAFRYRPHVHVLSDYEIEELPVHMANINPHVAVLASVVPETFSYALSELLMLGVPPLALRGGSFAERIEHGRNGYFFWPDAPALVAALRMIDADRDSLARVRASIAHWEPRTAGEMIADYHRILPSTGRVPQSPAPPHANTAQDAVAASQAMTIASMWKEIKRLNLQLSLVNEARQQAQERYEALEAGLEDTLKEQKAGILARDDQIEHLTDLYELRNQQLEELHASTSWRVSAPIRSAGHLVRKMRILGRSASALAGDPAEIAPNAANLARAWRAGGVHEVKKALVALQPSESYGEAWLRYRETFARDVKPRIVAAVETMRERPLISVIMPTYNTPEGMLRAAIDSVRAQLYPQWELCVADDGSSEPHVEQVVNEYAAKDERIRFYKGAENRGVAYASNRALDRATGEFVVLFDHDDLLEEQALFRVAECVLADAPDMLYSDEILVAPDGGKILRFAYRPAFSPEYLRSHPYIVHLTGFRRTLLREIGGFDEALRISQDYDLILRASEKAKRIVHVPEVLYQWRVHEASAGSQKMGEVMQTSKAILARHLARSGDTATVEDGVGFNLFDVRYPLRAGLKVAIIIPSKNHGGLVKQCIESIRRTVSEVPYDIVVVDHDSQDPATLAYFESISSSVKLLRYAGPFNFSAINNFAVAHLDVGYSHYLFCNNDIEATHAGWLGRMLELGQQPSIGIVGAKLLYPDGKSIQHAGVCVGAYGAAEHYAKRVRPLEDLLDPGFVQLLQVSHEVAAVTAACMLIRREVFEQVRGFDEAIAVGFGDVDLCLRAWQKGFRILFCPFASLMHHESYTRGTSVKDPHPVDSALFRLKWKTLLRTGDPYHNPGLSLTSSNWALARPLHCSFPIRRRIVTRGLESGLEKVSFSSTAARTRIGTSLEK